MSTVLAILLLFYTMNTCTEEVEIIEETYTCADQCLERGADNGFVEDEVCWCMYKPEGREDVN